MLLLGEINFAACDIVLCGVLSVRTRLARGFVGVIAARGRTFLLQSGGLRTVMCYHNTFLRNLYRENVLTLPCEHVSIV